MNNQTAVAAHEIEVKTPQMEVFQGIAALAAPSPRPDLAGLRVTPLTRGPVFMINPAGLLQVIPNPSTYNNLFENWDGIVSMDTTTVMMGPALTDGAILARGNTSQQLYLVSNGEKRWITSPAEMEKYHFSFNRVFVVPQVLIDSIRTGTPW